VAGGDAILLGVVVESVSIMSSVGGSPRWARSRAIAWCGLWWPFSSVSTKSSIRSRFTGVPLMCKKTAYHLDAIARQADHPFDVVGRWVFRKPEYDDITALRLRCEYATGNERQRGEKRKGIAVVAIAVFGDEHVVADEQSRLHRTAGILKGWNRNVRISNGLSSTAIVSGTRTMTKSKVQVRCVGALPELQPMSSSTSCTAS